MENEERFDIILNIKGDVDEIKSTMGSLQKEMSNIQLPKGLGKEFETRMRKLSDEVENFEKLASKTGDSFEGAKQIDASYKKILDYARKVEISFSAIKKEANLDASKFFPKEIVERIEKAEEAVKNYEKAIAKGDEALQKQKKSLKDIESALAKNEQKRAELTSKRDAKKVSYNQINSEQGKIKTTKSNELAQEQKNLEILRQKKIALDAEKAAVEALAKKKEALEKSEKAFASKNTQYGAEDKRTKAEKDILDVNKRAYEEASQAAKKYGDTVRSIEDIELDQSKTASSIEATKTAIKGLGNEIDAADNKIKKAQNAFDTAEQELRENEIAANSLNTQMKTLKTTIEQTENAAKAKGLKELVKSLDDIGVKVDPAVSSFEEVQKVINNLKPDAIKAITDALNKAGVNLDELGISLGNLDKKNIVFQKGAEDAKRMKDQINGLKSQVQHFFSLTNSVILFRRGVQQAIETVKELDKAMTETAVVTDFSVGDMWEDLPRYTKAANELGTTTLGAYETMTLFYQQGLETNEVFEIGTETMKMARIAGLEYKDATDLMTAALRGFNMELNETSAKRVNDVYSELAAITAADTQEIANAMTKTASIANSANMEFETTAALLSQIIETTREPAETAGTALKTIIARFTEMKKATSDIINVDGEEVNVNKVEAALKSAGVALRDTNGEFRDLDDVFLELSSKWNNLDIMTQRYIATTAAGSRQQSRFIAMMQDYERTIELVDAAYSSSGASQDQFEKTQDSLESKLNKLKNAWDEFLMGISNNDVIKKGVDALTALLNVVNKLTGDSGIAKLAVAIGALKGGSAIFNKFFDDTLLGETVKKYTGKKENKKGFGITDLTGKLTSFTKKYDDKKIEDIAVSVSDLFKNLKPNMSGLIESIKNFGGTAKNAGGTAFKIFQKVFAAIPGWAKVAAVAIAAIGAALHAVWQNSGLQKAKRQAEADAKTLKDTQEYAEKLTEKVNELGDAWQSLESGTEILDNLAKGTIEWTKQVQKLNDEVMKLAQKYPELYKFITVDQETGLWSIDEKQFNEFKGKLEQEEKEVKNRENFESMMSTYSSGKYEALKVAAEDDGLWNMFYSSKKTQSVYEDKMQKAYLEATGQEMPDGMFLEDYFNLAPTIEGGLLDSSVLREYIETGDNDLYKAILKYYDTEGLLEQQLKDAQNVYVKSYMASSGKYSSLVQNAVAETMAKGKDASELLEEKRGSYDGKWRGKANKTKGTGEGYDKSIQQIMKDRGFEVVNEAKGYYYNKTTDKYVNVNNLFGGAGTKTDTITVNGEQKTAEVWSNEYVTDLNRQEQIREDMDSQMDTLATVFQLDSDLAKVAAFDWSADVSNLVETYKAGAEIEGLDSETLTAFLEIFDVGKTVDDFVAKRNEALGKYEQEYGTFIAKDKNSNYTQDSYQALQEVSTFEQKVQKMGKNSSQQFTQLFIKLKQFGNEVGYVGKEIDEALDFGEVINSEDFTVDDLANSLHNSGVSAEDLSNFIDKIDMSSAINGARQLQRAVEEGGESAILAYSTIAMSLQDGGFFSLENQFKELIAGDAWQETTQASLHQLFNANGEITAENIRELAKENSDLAAVLDLNSIKASGFAKMMEAVERGTISLTDITADLIEAYDELYYAAGLAEEVLDRINSVDTGESDTKIGNTYSNAIASIKSLFSRGAYGDSQIDKFAEILVGEKTWQAALTAAGGDKKAAFDALDSKYHFSSMDGNFYGALKAELLKSENGTLGGGAIFIDAKGNISYDKSKLSGGKDLANKIQSETGWSTEFIEALIADMQIYSTDFDTDLNETGKVAGFDNFIKKRTTTDGETKTLTATKEEIQAFAEEQEKTYEGLLAELSEDFDKIQSKESVANGYVDKITDLETGEVEFELSEKSIENAKKQYEEVFVQEDGTTLSIDIVSDETGTKLTDDTLDRLLQIEGIREIILDPTMDDTKKKKAITEFCDKFDAELDDATITAIANGLTGTEAKTKAQELATTMKTKIYNSLVEAFQALATLLKEKPFNIGLSFSMPKTDKEGNVIGWTKPIEFVATLGGKNTSFDGGTSGDDSGSGTGGGGGGTTQEEEKEDDEDKEDDTPPPTGDGIIYPTGDDPGNGTTPPSGGGKTTNDTNIGIENVKAQIKNLQKLFKEGKISPTEYYQGYLDLITQANAAYGSEIKKLLSSKWGKHINYDPDTGLVTYKDSYYGLDPDDQKEVNSIFGKITGYVDDWDEVKNMFGEYAPSGEVGYIDNIIETLNYNREHNLISLDEWIAGMTQALSAREIITKKAWDHAKGNNPEGYGKYISWSDETGPSLNHEAIEADKLPPEIVDKIVDEYNKDKEAWEKWKKAQRENQDFHRTYPIFDTSYEEGKAEQAEENYTNGETSAVTWAHDTAAAWESAYNTDDAQVKYLLGEGNPFKDEEGELYYIDPRYGVVANWSLVNALPEQEQIRFKEWYGNVNGAWQKRNQTKHDWEAWTTTNESSSFNAEQDINSINNNANNVPMGDTNALLADAEEAYAGKLQEQVDEKIKGDHDYGIYGFTTSNGDGTYSIDEEIVGADLRQEVWDKLIEYGMVTQDEDGNYHVVENATLTEDQIQELGELGWVVKQGDGTFRLTEHATQEQMGDEAFDTLTGKIEENNDKQLEANKYRESAEERREIYAWDSTNAVRAIADLETLLANGQIDIFEYIKQKTAYEDQIIANAQDATADFRENNPNSIYLNYDPETGLATGYSDAFNQLPQETQEALRPILDVILGLSDDVKDIKNNRVDKQFRVEGTRVLHTYGEAMITNAKTYLAALESKEKEIAGYKQIISALPQEVQGPLGLVTGMADLVYGVQRNQLLKQQAQGLEYQLNAFEQNAFYKDKYYYEDPITGDYILDEAAFSTLKTEEERQAVLSEMERGNAYKAEHRSIMDALNGGFFQKPFYIAAEAAEELSKSFKDASKILDISAEDIEKALDTFSKIPGMNSEVFSKFLDVYNSPIFSGIMDVLSKEINSLDILSDEQLQELFNSQFGQQLGENMKELIKMVAGKDVTTNGANFASALTGAMGETLTFIGDSLSFENIVTGLNMVNQVVSMIEQLIGYITQATQVIIEAWTNREDYLYNFLKQIEKHLQEYEELQRYSTQIEKGRLTSSQDILDNWNNQWASLQLQLEEQTERLETRQQELDRSRWNPFALISGWDPTSDTLYENREVKMLWDIAIGLGEAFAPFGTGAFFSQLNQLYEDYDSRVQKSYEDRLAAEQALLDVEDQRLELVKVGSDEATQFEQKILESLVQKEQQQIDELSRLNDSITEANQKLLSTLQNNLDKIRQDRENEKKEEELGEKERRLAYLRQDTSGANAMEIKKLEEELEEEHEDYTDTLIDQKISELEEQNELAAEQRQQQIDLLQGQLDYAEKYGLYWDAIYGMLYTIDENGKAVLNSDNFDLDGNIRENSELAKLLGTFSDRMGMSIWSQVLDNEETKRLGRYYGAFIGMNGVDGNWANYWALLNPGANDPNYAYPQQEIPDGLWGILYNLEIGIKKYFGNSNLGLVNGAGRIEESFKNFFGKLFGYDEWANYDFTGFNPAHTESTVFSGIKNATDDMKAWFASGFDNLTKGNKIGTNIGGTQNYGAVTENYNFNIGTVGENISLDEMADKVVSAIKGLFAPNGVAYTDKGH